MDQYIAGLQAELDALNARRAPILAQLASDGFAGLSEREQHRLYADNNSAAAQAASLEVRILAALP